MTESTCIETTANLENPAIHISLDQLFFRASVVFYMYI